ncbi:MAG: dual specificity protein phosphatase family protein [Myxococcales bacterium]|nr:dual specificity protein phosphatase family protein [Myxococcales bacterium]
MNYQFQFDRITKNIFVGPYPPDQESILQLKNQHGVTAILNLQSDDDLRRRGILWDRIWGFYTAHNIIVERVPIIDFAKADLQQQLGRAVSALHRMLSEHHTVYVHCNAGINRSPTVTIAYLAEHAGMSLTEAELFVTSRRECMPYTDVVQAWQSTRR